MPFEATQSPQHIWAYVCVILCSCQAPRIIEAFLARLGWSIRFVTLSFCGPLASLVCIVVVCVFFAACLAFVFVWMLPFSIFLCGFCVSIALFLLLFLFWLCAECWWRSSMLFWMCWSFNIRQRENTTTRTRNKQLCEPVQQNIYHVFKIETLRTLKCAK